MKKIVKTKNLFVGRRKSKASESRKELSRKRLRLTKETVAAQKCRNKILRTQHKVGLITCKVDDLGEGACDYISLMRKKAFLRARTELSKATAKPIINLPICDFMIVDESTCSHVLMSTV